MSERSGLKVIAEIQEQRTFRSRLETYFSQNVNKDGVYEYLLISVSRIVHQLGSLLQDVDSYGAQPPALPKLILGGDVLESRYDLLGF